MKVLVLGPGGREHAIIRALIKDPAVQQVDAAPGNAGIAQLVVNLKSEIEKMREQIQNVE